MKINIYSHYTLCSSNELKSGLYNLMCSHCGWIGCESKLMESPIPDDSDTWCPKCEHNVDMLKIPKDT